MSNYGMLNCYITRANTCSCQYNFSAYFIYLLRKLIKTICRNMMILIQFHCLQNFLNKVRFRGERVPNVYPAISCTPISAKPTTVSFSIIVELALYHCKINNMHVFCARSITGIKNDSNWKYETK